MDQETLLALLEQWESVYKKGLLTFWLLLLLHERPMYVFEMGQELDTVSQGTINVDEKSLYRALRRFEATGLVQSSWQPSDIGPRRRYYHLTELGTELLRRFTRRNILRFQQPAVADRLDALLQQDE
ncbi:MAG: PadR family transcriptional regulator [Anaerolineae bacterium]